MSRKERPFVSKVSCTNAIVQKAASKRRQVVTLRRWSVSMSKQSHTWILGLHPNHAMFNLKQINRLSQAYPLLGGVDGPLQSYLS